MKQIARRRTVGIFAAMAVTALVATACSDDNKDDASATGTTVATTTDGTETTTATETTGAAEDVELTAADGTKVTLTGPIAAKYASATEEQKTDLGKPLTGEDASGTSESGVVFQQFDGGVITAANADAGTPAYITWGVIRDAWNVLRDESGQPSDDGKGGSAGPLGAATSDETEEDGVKKSTFQNGEITFDTETEEVTVIVEGEEVETE